MTNRPCNPDAEHDLDRGSGLHTLANKAWMTVQDVTGLVLVSRDSVARWIASGELRAVNISGDARTHRPSWRISSLALDEFLESRATRPPAPSKSAPHKRTSGVVEFVK
jgi:excisionase family DNA binding protein